MRSALMSHVPMARILADKLGWKLHWYPKMHAMNPHEGVDSRGSKVGEESDHEQAFQEVKLLK